MSLKEKNNKSIYIAFASIFVWLGIVLIYNRLISPMIVDALDKNMRIILQSIVIPWGVAMPISFLILRRVTPYVITDKKKVSTVYIIKSLIIQSGLGMLILFVFNSILIATGLVDVNANMNNGSLQLFNVFLLLIFNPIAEEFYFRKLILDRLMSCGKLKAIIISALLFALPHFVSQGIATGMMTFTVSLIWAYVRIDTGTLWLPIVLHSFANLWVGILPVVLSQTELGLKIYMIIWIMFIPLLSIVTLLKEKKKIMI